MEKNQCVIIAKLAEFFSFAILSGVMENAGLLLS